MAGETDPAELLPAKIMLLIIELAGPEAALKALPTMSKTWLGLTQQYFGGLETLNEKSMFSHGCCRLLPHPLEPQPAAVSRHDVIWIIAEMYLQHKLGSPSERLGD